MIFKTFIDVDIKRRSLVETSVNIGSRYTSANNTYSKNVMGNPKLLLPTVLGFNHFYRAAWNADAV